MLKYQKLDLDSKNVKQMMNLKVIGTGSKGNAYLLENEQEALLIECGVSIQEIKKAVNFNISKISGCLVTHEHGDHAKSINEVMAAGINTYATVGTFRKSAFAVKNHRQKEIPQKGQFQVGNFKVISFPTIHDVEEPCGFLIYHKECGVTLFLTDTVYSGFKFKGLNNIIIEANYDEAIINSKLSDRKFLRDRILKSHMSLDTCMDFLKENDLSQVNNIVLIHLSDSNSHELNFVKEVSEFTGKNVCSASNGLMISFGKTPF